MGVEALDLSGHHLFGVKSRYQTNQYRSRKLFEIRRLLNQSQLARQISSANWIGRIKVCHEEKLLEKGVSLPSSLAQEV